MTGFLEFKKVTTKKAGQSNYANMKSREIRREVLLPAEITPRSRYYHEEIYQFTDHAIFSMKVPQAG
jgi:hypothetical protein